MIWLSFGRAQTYYSRHLVAERIYWGRYRWTPFVRLRLRRRGEEELPF